MLGEHDHHRIDAREMFGASSSGSVATSRRGRCRCDGRNWRRSGGGECQRARLSAAANSGASPSSSMAERAEGALSVVVAGSSNGGEARRFAVEAEEQRPASSAGCQSSRAVVVRSRAGRRATRARARRRALASSAICVGSARSASARSRPGPREEGLRRQGAPAVQAPTPRPCGRASAGPASASRSSGCHQPSPAGSARGTIVQVEREMGEDVADGADRVRRGCGASSLQSLPGSAAIPPSRPLAGRRTSQTSPSRSIHQAMPWRCGRDARCASAPGKASGSPLAKAAQSALQRAVAATRRLRAADGRAEVHHRLGEIAGPVGRASSRARAARSRPRRAAAMRVQPGDHPLDIGVDRRAPARRTRSRRSRPRCRRRCPGSCAKLGRGSREAAAPRDFAGAGDEVAGAGIIAKAGPFGEDRPRRVAAASASIVGQRATNRSNRGVTVATVVCWSMTSLSHTR